METPNASINVSYRPTSLVDLAPSVLALITRLLQIRALLKLALLSGSSVLFQKCTRYGAVTELCADYSDQEDLRTFVDFSARLGVLFPHLTHLCLFFGQHCVPSVPIWPLWTTTLPPTLTHIEFDFDEAMGVWLRPIDPATDDDWTLLACQTLGHVPESLNKRFPQLQTLKLRGNRPAWTRSMFQHFVDNLPPSLTELTLPHRFHEWFGNNAPPVNPSPSVLQHLETFSIFFDRHDNGLWSLLTDKKLDHTMQERLLQEAETFSKNNDKEAIKKFLAPLRNLRRLGLHNVLGDACLPLIRHLDNLEYLGISYISVEQPLALPQNLTDLALALPRNLDISGATLRELLVSVPQLTSLELDINQHSLELIYLPPRLTHLELIMRSSIFADELPLTLACALPPSLTSLVIPDLEFYHTFLRLDTLTSLQTLHLSALTIITPSGDLCPLPSSLTSVWVYGTLSLGNLLQLPSSITDLSVRLQAEDALYSFLGTFSDVFDHATFIARLRHDFLPHVANLDVQIYPASDVPWATTLHKLDLNGSFRFQLTKLPHLTRLRSPYQGIQVENLPSTLLGFTCLLDLNFPKPLNNATPPVWNCTALQELECNVSGRPQHFYSELLSLRSLKKLKLTASITDSAWITHLPHTLTDFDLFLKTSTVFIKGLPPDWLPNLTSFTSNAIFSYAELKPLLPRLESLNIEGLAIGHESIPDLHLTTQDDIFNPYLLRASCLRLSGGLFPPTLRSRNIKRVAVDWNENALQILLPVTVKHLHLDVPPILSILTVRPMNQDLSPNTDDSADKGVQDALKLPIELFSFIADDWVQYLPPGLLSLHCGLALSGCALRSHLLPKTLTRLRMETSDLRFDLPQFLSGLPPSVTDLCLTELMKVDLDKALATALPVALTVLKIRVFEVGDAVLSLLPASLRHLTLIVGSPDFQLVLHTLPPNLFSFELKTRSSALPEQMASHLRKTLPSLALFYGNDQLKTFEFELGNHRSLLSQPSGQ